jgi:hypothetical protein
MQAIEQFKNRLFIFSFGLGLASTVGIFQPNTTIREVAKVALGVSIAGVVTGELAASKAISTINQDSKKLDEKLRTKDKENIAITRNLDKTINELANFKTQSTKLENELQQALEIIQSRNNELTNVSNTVYDLQNKLRDVGRFSTTEAYKMVRDTYNRSLRKLEAHIEALMRNYAPIADDLNNVLIEVDKFRNRWMQKLEAYETITNFNELLDTGLDFQQKIIEGCIELRVKGQQICIRYLDNLLTDSVSYSMYESDIINLQNHAGSTIKELKDENEAQVRAIVTDWVTANNQHVERYQINYTELIEQGKQAIGLLQEREILIQQLQDELEQLRKPWTFTGSIDYAVAGNAIINFYHKAYGYILDAMAWQETETGYILTFATSRNKTYLTADMLHDKDNREQLAGLTNALQLPTFTPNYQSGLIVLEVNTRKPVKKPPVEKDISKLWVTADKFEKTVKNWTRVRITGGSESGKSPTAENLAVAILKHRPGAAKLFNPQHDSVKNYWTIPAVGTSHQDSEKGIKALAEKLDARTSGDESKEQFEIWLFDEVDSTMGHTKSKRSTIGNHVNFIIKQVSHQNLGAIFIGQNANVSEYPGMDRSDWNNAVNLHIGANCYDAITNSNRFTTDEITRLKNIADKLTEFCNQKNEELGLDKTDPKSYRFGFVVEPDKKPYFIELPSFGAYTYDLISDNNLGVADSLLVVASQQHSATQEPKSLDNTYVASKAAMGIVGSCPKCSSSNTKKNGTTKTAQKHLCKDCGHHWSNALPK